MKINNSVLPSTCWKKRIIKLHSARNRSKVGDGESATANVSERSLSSELIPDHSNVLYNFMEPVFKICLARKREIDGDYGTNLYNFWHNPRTIHFASTVRRLNLEENAKWARDWPRVSWGTRESFAGRDVTLAPIRRPLLVLRSFITTSQSETEPKLQTLAHAGSSEIAE